jgi:curved DNA-binding protein
MKNAKATVAEQIAEGRARIAELLLEIDHIVLQVNPHIEAEYATKIGYLENDLLKWQIAARRARRRYALAQARANSGEAFAADEFEAQRRQYSDNAGGYNFGGFGGFGDFSSGSSNTSGFSDFFEQLFGNGAFASRGRWKAGEDIEANLSIPLRDAAVTHKQTFSINGENIRITIPAGIADGQRIRLKGRGKAATGSNVRGDLYITFRIEPDNIFMRNGDDLHVTVITDMYTLILGGEAIVPTLDGNARISIKPGTQPDSTLRLRGKGFPVYKKEGSCGDLLVKLRLQLPTLNERQKELLRRMREEA